MHNHLGKFQLHLVDRFRRTDSLKLYQELLKTQWCSRQKIDGVQWMKIKDLLNHAYNNVPYYRILFDTHGLKPNKIRNIMDFRRLPILTKDIIRANSGDMLAFNRKSFQPRKRGTSGSTGIALPYYIDRKSHSEQWANVYRIWHIGGWGPGDKIIVLAGSSLHPSLHALRKWIYVGLNNWLLLSAFNMSEDNMMRWVSKIKRFKARFMHGYPTSIYIFARFLEDNNIRDIRFQAVFTTAEMLQPKYRDIIGKVFSCPVFDLYGAGDGNGYAFECEEHEGLHCASESSYIELLTDDGGVASNGQPGQIITTDLSNYAMPFIRYKVGDIAIPNSEPCKCGRGLPILKKILGRSNDFVTTKNGQIVHGTFFEYLFRVKDWISQFYVVQESESQLSVYLKPNKSPPISEVKSINRILQAKFNRMTVNISFTQNIPTSPSGKFKFIVNKTLT